MRVTLNSTATSAKKSVTNYTQSLRNFTQCPEQFFQKIADTELSFGLSFLSWFLPERPDVPPPSYR
ncbi:MAG TPA: hypothetical protein V6C90_14820 [Coleofasciculaceae cyanobacterium]